MRTGCLLFLLLYFVAAEILRIIRDPYNLECASRNIICHPKAICQMDALTSDFYCRCLPGFNGDGVNFCQEPDFRITVSNLTTCDGLGEQACLLKTVPGSMVTFTVSVFVNAEFHSYVVRWYKFYTGQAPQFRSYRKRLSSMENVTQKVVLSNHGTALTLSSVNEDDFFPNLFWAEVKSIELPDVMDTVEAYDLTGFQMLNPSSLRYYFLLDIVPIDVGEFLEGDTVAIKLPFYLGLSPSSYVRWIKEPRPMTLLDSQAVGLSNGTEGIQIKVEMDTDFGYVRALVFDFNPGIPGRVLVAQRLFYVAKDITKACIGGREDKNCHCNSGFEGNGVHCIDINECLQGMPMSCLPEAECVNSYGSYFCRCPDGLEGDGLTNCIDIDECTRNSHRCAQDATCLNTVGSYVCVCQSGFIGDGIHCKAKSIWSPWSPWSLCSVTCGFQNQMRIRQCTHPESGMRCVGPSADLKLCPHLPRCPTDGNWSEWSPWSVCPNECSGVRKRIRECDSPVPSTGGLPCEGDKEEVSMCNEENCPVDGMWSPWSSWTPCPISCGHGVIRRSRRCNNPAPLNDGKDCSGHGYEEGSCGFPIIFCQYLTKSSDAVMPGKLIQ